MSEQILKRLQDTMKMFMIVLEQLEQLQWTTKDLIEDLEEELHPVQVQEDASKTSKIVKTSKEGVDVT